MCFIWNKKVSTFQVIVKGKQFLGGHNGTLSAQMTWGFMPGPQAVPVQVFSLCSLPQLPHTEHYLLCCGICLNCDLSMGCLSSPHEALCLPCFSFEVLPVWQEWDTANLWGVSCRLNLRLSDAINKGHRDKYLRTGTHTKVAAFAY